MKKRKLSNVVVGLRFSFASIFFPEKIQSCTVSEKVKVTIKPIKKKIALEFLNVKETEYIRLFLFLSLGKRYFCFYNIVRCLYVTKETETQRILN